MSEQILDFSILAQKIGIKNPTVFPKNKHICHFYRTKSELLDLLVPYFREGLFRKEFCLWGVTDPLSVEEAKESLRQVIGDIQPFIDRKQLEIFDISKLYGGTAFDALIVRDAFLKKVKSSLAAGWNGFRCDGITAGVRPEEWKNLQVYEDEVTKNMSHSITALCSYNVTMLNPRQVIDVAETHTSTLIKKDKNWYIVATPR